MYNIQFFIHIWYPSARAYIYGIVVLGQPVLSFRKTLYKAEGIQRNTHSFRKTVFISENPIQGVFRGISINSYVHVYLCITYNCLYTYGIPVLGQPALSFRENL